ncbi:MAG: hypothetical protein ACOZNI_28080 [Myxococcota bacterium]
MTVLFTVDFDDQPITVLEVRGRPAFLPRQLAIAAGYSAPGQRFVDQIVRDWAGSLEEDEDIARLDGAELAALRRDLPDWPDVRDGLVLFLRGASKCLRVARVRRSLALADFLGDTVLPRFVGAVGSSPPLARTALARAMAGEEVPSGSKAALAEAVAKLKALGVRFRKADDRKGEYRELVQLADALREDHVVTHEEWGALRVEAMEHLLGRPLRTRLGLADLILPN